MQKLRQRVAAGLMAGASALASQCSCSRRISPMATAPTANARGLLAS